MATGVVSILHDAVIGDFFFGETVLRSPATKECVARVRKDDDALQKSAGEITVSGSFASPDVSGEPIQVLPSPPRHQYVRVMNDAKVFPLGSQGEVTIQSTGSDTHPPMPPTKLHPSEERRIMVLSPAVSSAERLTISSTQPLDVTWQAPSHRDDRTPHRMVVALWFVSGADSVGEIRCGFDLARGRGLIPSELLRALKTRIDPVSPITNARFRVFAGDWTEVRAANVSYVVELGSFENTNIGEVDATLE